MTGSPPVAIAKPVDVADCDLTTRLLRAPLDRFPTSVLPQDWCTVVAGDKTARARVQAVDRTRRWVWLQVDPAGLQQADMSSQETADFMTGRQAWAWRELIAVLSAAAAAGELPARAAYLAALHAVHSLARHPGRPEVCGDECATVAAGLVDTSPGQTAQPTLFVGGPHAGWRTLDRDEHHPALRFTDQPLVPIRVALFDDLQPITAQPTFSTYVRTRYGLSWDVYEHVPDAATAVAVPR